MVNIEHSLISLVQSRNFLLITRVISLTTFIGLLHRKRSVTRARSRPFDTRRSASVLKKRSRGCPSEWFGRYQPRLVPDDPNHSNRQPERTEFGTKQETGDIKRESRCSEERKEAIGRWRAGYRRIGRKRRKKKSEASPKGQPWQSRFRLGE